MSGAGDEQPRRLGRGRSAVVYLGSSDQGDPVVQKVFTGEGVSKMVLYVLTGAPNPYTWCEAAVRSAVARRRILAPLVRFWFGDKVRLPDTLGWDWNEAQGAFEIRAEYIKGRHAPLRSPFGDIAPDPVDDLVHGVMKPLQGFLRQAGLDGLVWQAGLGNPVAASNFLLESDEEDLLRWVWLDLESGLPALFAMNPLATVRFYLPKSAHHRRWLFDDVDVPKLQDYLKARRAEIESVLGAPAWNEMTEGVTELEEQQRSWKAVSRHRRSIAYELSRQRITREQADWYSGKPLRWFARLLAYGTARGVRHAARWTRRAWTWLRGVSLWRLATAVWLFTVSQRFRWHLARRYVSRRIRAWADRKFLDRKAARRLWREVNRDDASAYLTDFCVHLAIKPFVKTLQWWVFPALLAFGWINLTTLGIVLVAGGLIARSLYTIGRWVQASIQGQRRPWVALIVGVLPVVGNAAYPAQLAYSGAAETNGLARFILYDTFATMGRAVPIWGGPDSLVEHFFNRLGDRMVRCLHRPVKTTTREREETPVEA